MSTLTRPRARRIVVVAASALTVGLALAGCGGGGTPSAAPGGSADELEAALEEGGTITYWSWTPSAEAQVAAFEKEYPNVDVKLVNAGTNTEEYTKLQNAITAGSGAPDVAQVEYYAIPQFALSESLVDLAPYGFGDLKDQYTPGPWGAVTVGDAVYGLPQDSGPMAMFYNATVFDEYGIEVPTTYDEYVAAAEKLHEADPNAYITSDTGDAGFATSMIWQAGGRPFSADGTNVSIDLQDEGSKKWADSWNRLVEQDLLATTPGWSDEWYRALGDGTIATLLTGAWMPGVLESSVPEASGDWRVAPMPTYDGTPVTAENGGGGQVVLKQSKNPALAAAFLKWLNADPASIEVFLASGGFPATTADLQSDEFLAKAPEYFGGQKINEVLVDAANNVPEGWQYLPYQVYANSIFGDTVGQSYLDSGDLNGGLEIWQQQLTDYGNQQGFTVE
ncbi:sugar ABC transporter substrate-binding protein [Microbacterium sp. EYE_5]|uniref:ABC transporter substrate-binding protein n=1 Tax=unclassified Microbacterium TaxID=2609290 RepID=UPI00200400C9|nr:MULTISPECIES: sugar ABC transporter substrate-binding protein [unclassified Microbacterium]MCK6080208.1 sugar ABC transporter substrate-binding protein [Microbacterium sp. EYE_382]MCK6085479.1 sugar ABC transporter substrate-binding protein [Microbacterium sp. EYE_384]MCK6122296.1 sugar ABC transporter substrate-binding protein [Microbacterium sp. EYE_80]MCK6126242.1 sugar ABC transporter substrate-binding protein [Microbacterium sp. EYE_79]MCK6141163.1 sugar ABC transporter substrate-bindi